MVAIVEHPCNQSDFLWFAWVINTITFTFAITSHCDLKSICHLLHFHHFSFSARHCLRVHACNGTFRLWPTSQLRCIVLESSANT